MTFKRQESILKADFHTILRMLQTQGTILIREYAKTLNTSLIKEKTIEIIEKANK